MTDELGSWIAFRAVWWKRRWQGRECRGPQEACAELASEESKLAFW